MELAAIANSGFSGAVPEVVVPAYVAAELALREVVEPEPASKLTGDGRVASMIRYPHSVKVYVLGGDRVEGGVVSDVLTLPAIGHVLLNDKLLSRLGIVIVDAGEGLWCFRDEMGRRIRRGV
ncbi:MAG: hypothetical protein DRK00_07485 [Thermoprotei archaeon]|nr:MAG: hypothetical protein DRK00_07485 [Thermoprotei archaeon]